LHRILAGKGHLTFFGVVAAMKALPI